MSKNGASRPKNKKGAQRSLTTVSGNFSARIPLVNLSQALQSPQLYGLEPSLSTTLSAILDSSKEMGSFITQLVNLAKNHNTLERNPQVASFIDKNKTFIEKGFSQIVGAVDYYCIQNLVPYDHMHARLSSLEQEISQIKDSPKKSDKTKFDSLSDTLAQKKKDSEQLFLLGFQKVNVWHALLVHGLPLISEDERTSFKEEIISKLFMDLNRACTMLIQRFLDGTLKEHDYYSYFEILMEKIQWTHEMGDVYQSCLYSQLQAENPQKSHQLQALKNTDFLLTTYVNVSLFLYGFALDSTAEAFKVKANKLIELFLPLSSQCKTVDKEDITAFQNTLVSTQKALAGEELKAEKNFERAELFKLLEYFYREDWSKCVTDKAYRDDFESSLNDVKLQMESFNKVGLPLFTLKLKTFLAFLSYFKAIPEDKLNVSGVTEVINLFLKIMADDLKKSSVSYIGLTLQAIVKKITQDIFEIKMRVTKNAEQKVSSVVVEQRVQQPVVKDPLDLDMDYLADQLAEVFLTSLDAQSTVTVDTKQQEELSAFKSQLDSQRLNVLATQENENQEKLKKQTELMEKRKQEIMKEHEERLAKEKALLEQSLKTELQQLKEKAEKENEALQKKLNSKVEKEIESVKKSNLNKFSAEKSKLDTQRSKLAENNQRELANKKAALEKENEQNISQLRQSHASQKKNLTSEFQIKFQTEIAQLSEKHKKDIESEEQKLKSEIQQNKDKLIHQHEEAVAKLKREQSLAFEREKQKTQIQGEQTIDALVSKHKEALLAVTQLHEQALKDMLKEHQQNLDKKLQALNEKNQRELEELQAQSRLKLVSSIPQNAVHEVKPLSQIKIPDEIRFITQDLEDAGIEFYLVGGYVRNRLLGYSPEVSEDFDIIINCRPDELPAKLKRHFKQNTLETKQFKMGHIDLWCEPWDNLKEFLMTKDISINTFIAKISTGEVFDLLGAAPDLHPKAKLRILGSNLKARLIKDPSLILRIIRFMNQLHRRIDPKDWEIIVECAPLISHLPIGKYLSNLQSLFISPYAILNYETFKQLGLLSNLFPSLSLDYSNIFESFIFKKFQDYACSPEQYDYYHVLALFTLSSLLNNQTKQVDLSLHLEECIERFFEGYKGELLEAEKQKIRKTMASIILDQAEKSPVCLGLYSEYLTFEQQVLSQHKQVSESKNSKTEQATASLTPQYRQYRKQKHSQSGNQVSNTRGGKASFSKKQY